MSVTEIEKAVRQLTRHDLAQFREWFAKFDAEQWDREFEQDVVAGRLDSLADKALDDVRQGRATEL